MRCCVIAFAATAFCCLQLGGSEEIAFSAKNVAVFNYGEVNYDGIQKGDISAGTGFQGAKQIPGIKRKRAAGNCDGTKMVVTGATYQTVLNGEYSLMAADCSGKPAYIDRGGIENLYLYAFESDSTWFWCISALFCNHTVSALVIDSASTPDLITAYWKEYSNTSDDFLASNWLDVTCYEVTGYSEMCDSEVMVVEGATYQALDGHYDIMSYTTCNGKSQYQLIRSGYENLYLYAYKEGFTWAWHIGPDRCSELSSAYAIDSASTPDLITSVWEELNPTFDSFYTNYDLGVECESGGNGRSNTNIANLGLMFVPILTRTIIMATYM